MGMTIEFYSANPQELIEIFSSEEDEELFFKTLETYPNADFSLHLLLPDDMDTLLRILQKRRPLLPSHFRDLLVQQLWSDDPDTPSESLTLLDGMFPRVLVSLSKEEIEGVAHDWVATFPSPSDSAFTNVYQALLALKAAAQDAVAHKKSLILRLVG